MRACAQRLGWLGRRASRLAPAVLAATVTLLIVRGIAPAPAQAIDLFPVDDWIGDGLKSVGKVALGPLKLTAGALAHLLGAIVAALADLLIPKSLVKAGVRAIKWLVQLPALGVSPTAPDGVATVRMPHLHELRDTLTWVGLTLLPLQIVLAGGRALLSPSAEGDAPAEVLQRTIAAAIGLLAFDLLWGALTRLVQLITDALLSLPWVVDGVRRMLQSLLIGGASGTAVASEFVLPLVLAVAGAVLLALMLLRVGLEVVASIVYVTGGLALGLSVSGTGHRLLQAWLVAATAVFVLPVLWCVVFVTGAALMVDAGSTGHGGFGDFVGQLYNVGAAIVTFSIAIKLARVTLGHAGTAIAGLAATAKFGGAGALRGARTGAPALAIAGAVNTPKSLARFSQNLRGGMRGAATSAVRTASSPVRGPMMAAARLGGRTRASTADARGERSRRANSTEAADVRPAGGRRRLSDAEPNRQNAPSPRVDRRDGRRSPARPTRSTRGGAAPPAKGASTPPPPSSQPRSPAETNRPGASSRPAQGPVPASPDASSSAPRPSSPAPGPATGGGAARKTQGAARSSRRRKGKRKGKRS